MYNLHMKMFCQKPPVGGRFFIMMRIAYNTVEYY